MKKLSLGLALASCLLFTACAAVQLNPGAQKVRLLSTDPHKSCKYLGEAEGSQGNAITGGWTSNDNLAKGARNDLKNKAFAMGGNAVVIMSNRDGHTSGRYGGSKTSSGIMGAVYKCPNM